MHEVEQGTRKKKMATHRVPIETYGLNSAIVGQIKAHEYNGTYEEGIYCFFSFH